MLLKVSRLSAVGGGAGGKGGQKTAPTQSKTQSSAKQAIQKSQGKWLSRIPPIQTSLSVKDQEAEDRRKGNCLHCHKPGHLLSGCKLLLLAKQKAAQEQPGSKAQVPKAAEIASAARDQSAMAAGWRPDAGCRMPEPAFSPSKRFGSKALHGCAEKVVNSTLDTGASKFISESAALHCAKPSDTQFACVNNAVVDAEVKGDLLLTLYDEYNPAKRIDLKITNTEGLSEQKDVLFSVTRFMQAGGVAHLETGNCSLTLAGQMIRIRDVCQLRTTVVMPKAKDDSAWMTVGKKGKPIARGPTSGAAHAATEPTSGAPAAAKNDKRGQGLTTGLTTSG